MEEEKKYPILRVQTKTLIEKFNSVKNRNCFLIKYNHKCYFYTCKSETESMLKILLYLYDRHLQNNYIYPKGVLRKEFFDDIGITQSSFMMNIWKLIPYYVNVIGRKTNRGFTIRFFKINECGIALCEKLMYDSEHPKKEDDKDDDIEDIEEDK